MLDYPLNSYIVFVRNDAEIDWMILSFLFFRGGEEGGRILDFVSVHFLNHQPQWCLFVWWLE